MKDLIGVLPELILALVGIIALFLPRRQIRYLASGGLLAGLVSLAWLPMGREFFFGTIRVDQFSFIFQALFMFVSLLIVLGSPDYIEGEASEAEYYSLILFATAGMLIVASAADLIALFVGFELSSLSTYALAAFFKREERSLEASIKFFIIGALSSAIALYGITLIYGAAGTMKLAEIARRLGEGSRLIEELGMLLILAGFGFKITAVPFHSWAPDTYEGAPTTITALLSTGSKKMGFAALFKIFFIGFIALKLHWIYLLAALALLTMTVGNLAALSQRNIKRLLAYSSIAQAGYIMIAFPVATEYALAGGIFHVITHSLMTAGAFLIVAALSSRGVGEELEDWGGLYKRAPLLALSMAVFLLSLAGIPPLAGFASKFVLFSSAVEAALNPGQGWFLWLAIVGVLNSALSVYYYARIIRQMYIVKPATEEQIVVSFGAFLPIALVLALVILIGLYPNPLISFGLRAAGSLFTSMPLVQPLP
ncbi:MAG: NADH-quinone oxidoreductase subunit N [Candidatus Bipolaricaulia bacterium]